MISGKQKSLYIDSSTGGNGDIWMRLVSFYAIAALRKEYRFYITIPAFLTNLARHTFGDRLYINEKIDNKKGLYYTSLGIRDLIKPVLKGKKFISPYQFSVIHDKKKKGFKDLINAGIFTMADLLGVVQIPDWKWITCYQGYLDIVGIKKIRDVQYDEYTAQLQADYTITLYKLNNNIPVSPELTIPGDLKNNVVVFPTGTSRQFVPLWWAKQYLPDAYFAFFYKDQEALSFVEAGLKVIYFYKEPGDIIQLSHNSRWTVSTDSFPSHLLQYATENCTITITEVLPSRIISPVFKGQVVHAEATCHPCLHLDRKNHPLCAAGYSECLNWRSKVYTQNLLSSIPLHKMLA